MKNDKPDLRKNNGGHSIKTKFPNGFVRIPLKLRAEEKDVLGKNVNDKIRNLIRKEYRMDLFPDGFEENKENPYFEEKKI